MSNKKRTNKKSTQNASSAYRQSSKNKQGSTKQKVMVSNKRNASSNMLFKIILALVAVFIIIIAVIIAISLSQQSDNNSQTPSDIFNPNTVWNQNMLMGNADATNKLVVYSDLFCPFCRKEAEAIHANEATFDSEYINNSLLNYEIRMTDILQSKSDDNSTRGGEMLYCAAEQGKFWDYYYDMLDKLNTEYFSKGIGAYHGAPEIPKLTDDFYLSQAEKTALDVTKMNTCLKSGTGLAELRKSTNSARAVLNSGLPAFYVNDKYVTSGFDGEYSAIKQVLTAGGLR
ncbi:MAG: thioredoxin domain-containing protein [Bifidobacteriaceae bacterium]|jgi:protein-disulfide isomerase|nr:thioredoxin domain-containing protein [Bifidobacteriaceae bacterium]